MHRKIYVTQTHVLFSHLKSEKNFTFAKGVNTPFTNVVAMIIISKPKQMSLQKDRGPFYIFIFWKKYPLPLPCYEKSLRTTCYTIRQIPFGTTCIDLVRS